MQYRKRYVAIQAAQAGMTLAAPADAVAAGSRAFSLPQGHVLTADNLQQLRQHRVEYIVASVPDPRPDAQIAEDNARAAEHVQRLFAGANLSDPCTAALLAQVLAFRST